MKKHLPLLLRIIVAVILVQTLRFKFTAHPDSVYIFTKVGLEPNGRILIGVLELIAAIQWKDFNWCVRINRSDTVACSQNRMGRGNIDPWRNRRSHYDAFNPIGN